MYIFRSYYSILFIALILSACSSGSVSQTKKSAVVVYNQPVPGKLSSEDLDWYYHAINAFYDSVFVAHGFNGGIIVAKKGQTIFEKYHGFGNFSTHDTLNEHSAFHIASVSKTFTAMGTLKLVQDGKLKLDDDIKLFFPAMPYDGITISMLLSHRSGLPNYLYFMQKLGWDIKKPCTNEDVVNYLIQFKPDLTSKPGTRFAYCNTNYALLGLIIEKASGKSYKQFLKDNFFIPLKMEDTYVHSLNDSVVPMPSYDWRGRQEAVTFLDEGFGDKNIYSTPRDLLKWDQALYNNQLFSAKTLEDAFTPYSNEKPGIRNYGFGWRMNIYPNGKKIVYHNGWWHGNNAVLLRLVQDSVTIIVLGNKYNRNIYKAKEMANIFQPYFEKDEEEKPENIKEDTLQAKVQTLPQSSKNKSLKRTAVKIKPVRKRKK
ncbi:MAG: beta-lactamase family protein [Chitinophagaceae bacterium]|nr:beta-lactamase family protein [Chitinophagaceae bacterium]